MRHAFSLSLLVFATAASAAPGPDPAAIVRAVDSVRIPDAPNLLIRLQLKTRSGSRIEPGYTYVLRIRRGAGALVEAIDGDQRGQKYLSTPNGYWFYAPRTRQAIRLTPLQLVRGQASVGDISRMRFSTDYLAALQPDASQAIEGVAAWALTLRAKSPQATYSTVALYVSKDGQRPLRADFMSAAGRRLKTVKFGNLANVSGHRIVQDTTFIDAVDPTKSTVLHLGKVEETVTPALMFKPQALGFGK